MSEPNNIWKMPEWMKPFEPYFNDRGALSIEASMNLYGAKCGNRLAQADPDLRAIVINAQVGLLVALHSAGLLGGNGRAAPQGLDLVALAERVDDAFVLPMHAFAEGSFAHSAFKLLRLDVAAIIAGKPKPTAAEALAQG